MSRKVLPELPLAEWKDTLTTIHMWSQIVGKIALSKTPLINHYWNATLRVTPRGLITLPMADAAVGSFTIEFDFVEHALVIKCESGATRSLKLRPLTVADFYAALTAVLGELGIAAEIWTMPVEVEEPIRFTDDTTHSSYDAEFVERFREVLVWINGVFTEFRSRFVGKSSPVHFFWGSFDLAVTRFNGDRAPERDGADSITREAYSHKCISHGFWCGGGGAIQEPAFYAYAAPEADGFKSAQISPPEGYYHLELNEFILPYKAVRDSASPEDTLLDFMQSTYGAAAELGHWDRDQLERPPIERLPR